MVVLHTYLSSPLPHRRLAEAGDVKKLLKLRDPDRRQLGRWEIRGGAAGQRGGQPPKGHCAAQGSLTCFFFFALLLVASLLLVVRPGAPSSVLAPSSKARSP